MKVNSARLSYGCGLFGSAILLFGSLIAALFYQGRGGESYCILNHFISELGKVGVSKFALVFNISLILGGLVLILYLLGLGSYIRTKRGYVATAVGIFSCVSCGLVGVFPMNHRFLHALVAYLFFYSGLIAITLFSLSGLFGRQKMSKWLSIPGMVAVASFASFLVVPHLSFAAPLRPFRLSPFARPDLILSAVLEWAIFFSVIAWFISTSISLLTKKQMRPRENFIETSSTANPL